MNVAPYSNEQAPLREELPGGAVLLSVPIRTAHAVTLGVWLRTGSQDEPQGLGGISHFLEHIVFKGSKNRSAFEIATTFDRLGAAVDAFTTKDLVAFTIKVLPEYFEAAVETLADMVLCPALDPKLVKLEQDVVCEEIQEAQDTPDDCLHDAFAARVYSIHTRGRPILGFPDTVRSFNSELLDSEHKRLFCGPNMVLSLAGNIQSDFRDIVVKHFAVAGSDAQQNAAANEPVTSPAAAMIAPADEILDPYRLELFSPIIQTYFEIGNLAISYAHEDRMPVFLLSNLLGGGMSSRIFQAVREREGLAYTVYTYNDMGRDIGLVSCSGSCSPEKIDRLEDVVSYEYARIISEGIKQEELDNNRAQIKSQLIFSLEGMVNQMYRSARNEILYRRFMPVAELVDQIDSVKTDDLVRCAMNYFNPESLLVATHGPEPEFDDD